MAEQIEDRYLVFYWSLDTERWVMIEGRQFASEELARVAYAEYCKVLGPERSRIVFTGDNHGERTP